MVDHKLGEVNVEVRVDKRAMASLSMTYVSVGPLIAIVSQVSNILLNIGATSYGALGHVPPPWSLRMYTNLAIYIDTFMYLQWAVVD